MADAVLVLAASVLILAFAVGWLAVRLGVLGIHVWLTLLHQHEHRWKDGTEEADWWKEDDPQ